jgi:hypothetical protein
MVPEGASDPGDARRAGPADHGEVSQHYATLSIGGYLAMTIVPVIVLAVWLITIYHSARHPEWRHTVREQGPPQIPGAGGVRVGRSVPGSLPVPVEPTSRTENQPD